MFNCLLNMKKNTTRKKGGKMEKDRGGFVEVVTVLGNCLQSLERDIREYTLTPLPEFPN